MLLAKLISGNICGKTKVFEAPQPPILIPLANLTFGNKLFNLLDNTDDLLFLPQLPQLPQLPMHVNKHEIRQQYQNWGI